VTSNDRLKLVNKIVALFGALNSVTSAWLHPLINPALDVEPELKNRLFCLMVCGLTDAGWEYRTRFNAMRKEIAATGAGPSTTYYLDAFERYVALAVDLLEQITREEMLRITELRNHWLHGAWTEISRERRTFRFARNGQIAQERISSDDYNAILRSQFESIASLDELLSRVRERLSGYRTFFWSVDRTLATPEIMQSIQQAIHSGSETPVTLTIPKVDFIPDPADNPVFLTLNDLSAVIAPSRPQ
jgi:hypothetical protein